MRIDGGTSLSDVPIGVICLESYFAKPPGYIRHPATFPFPILYEVVRGVDVTRLLFEGDKSLLEPFLVAARALEAQGVKAIAGSCGFLARYQRELTEAVSTPVFASSLVQLPIVAAMIGPTRKVGVPTASEQALTREHFARCGAIATRARTPCRRVAARVHRHAVFRSTSSADARSAHFRSDHAH